MSPSKGGTVLSAMAKMTEAVVENKAKAARNTLTPIAAESPIPAHPLTTLTEDPDIILGRLADAEREVLAILEAIHRLQQAWGKPDEALEAMKATDEALLQKERERRADDAAKAREGDKAAAARVESEKPIEQVEAQVTRRRNKKAEDAAELLRVPFRDPEEEPAAIDVVAQMAAAQAAVFGPGGTLHPSKPEPLTDDNSIDADEADTPVIAAAKAAASQPGATPQSVMKAALNAAAWVCPEHGDEEIATKISAKRKVQFRACMIPDCGQFEHV